MSLKATVSNADYFNYWEMLLTSVVKAVQVSVAEIDMHSGTGSLMERLGRREKEG